MKGEQYVFHTGAKAAISTYQGCVLIVKGDMDFHFIANETTMRQYINLDADLEQLRSAADRRTIPRGPIAMAVGPSDVGKSTLCKILLNYAIRQGRTPIYVDLDVGLGDVSLPGTIGAFVVKQMAHTEHGFSHQTQRVYQFGQASQCKNGAYYELLVTKLAHDAHHRMRSDNRIKSSGMIINTGGWIEGDGYQHILHAATEFKPTIIFVLDNRRLYNDLVREIPRAHVKFLQKSSGAVNRNKKNRSMARKTAIREYFYGKRCNGQQTLHPYSFDVKWTDIQICQIDTKKGDQPKLCVIEPNQSILYHILAETKCQSITVDVINSNVVGYVCVYVLVQINKKKFDSFLSFLFFFMPGPMLMRNVKRLLCYRGCLSHYRMQFSFYLKYNLSTINNIFGSSQSFSHQEKDCNARLLNVKIYENAKKELFAKKSEKNTFYYTKILQIRFLVFHARICKISSSRN